MRYQWIVSKTKQQEGAAAVTLGLLMIVLVGFAALSIDVGYLMVTRNELQNVADAAALAAARKLGNNYENMTKDEQLAYTCETVEFSMPCSDIIVVAQEAGIANRAGQLNIEIKDSDIFIGVWDYLNNDPAIDSFTAQNANPKAVRVIARRDDLANNPITTFLAGVLGIDTLAVSAVATAALNGQGTAAEGELELPIGIDGQFFEDGGDCGDKIKFSPTPDSCAGWTTFDEGSNVPNLKALLDGTVTNPTANVGDYFNYIGGDLATAFTNLLLAYRDNGYDIKADGSPVLLDPATGEPKTGALDAEVYDEAVPLLNPEDGTQLYYPQLPGEPQPLEPRNKHVWPSTVVVYAPNACANPQGSLETIGFAKIKLEDVLDVPVKTIIGTLECDSFSDEATRGGGGAFGTFGTIPNLVQ